MTSDDDGRRDLLRRRFGEWLRDGRLELGLSQRQLGEESRSYPWPFDATWISHWERSGPREGFVKGLAYLDMLDADFELLLDLLRAPIEMPRPDADFDPARVDAAVRRLVLEGRLAEGLGLSLRALEDAERSALENAEPRLLLLVGIVAKRSELYGLAKWAATRAIPLAQREAGGELLAARAAVLAATVSTWQGYPYDALRLLDTVAHGLREEDADLDAVVCHARGFAQLEIGQYAEAGFEYRRALDRYPRPRAETLRPVLMCCLALARASAGFRSEALRILESVLESPAPEPRPYLDASLRQVAGRVLLACGRPREAVRQLVAAEKVWRDEGLNLRLLETRLLLMMAARQSHQHAIAELMQRSLRNPAQRRRIPERLQRLRLQIDAAGGSTS
ncbi:MAG: hypothetical protein Kow0062_09760 [Acidobacteriota bacterium]